MIAMTVYHFTLWLLSTAVRKATSQVQNGQLLIEQTRPKAYTKYAVA